VNLPQQPCSDSQVPGTFLSASKGLCRECNQLVQVRYIAIDERVYLERRCPTHGVSRALVAESLAWYLDAMQQEPHGCPPKKTIAKQAACPQACGPCEFHAQACRLPVFSITNACNLRCPICFTYNRKDKTYFMSPKEFGRQIDYLIETTGGVDLINITGGEPSLHPELFELLALAHRPKIGRITMNTNGLKLAKDPEFARRLADAGVYVVLSLDTLDSDLSLRIHGKDICADKLKALENLARFEVPTTLLMVLIGGVNEGELGKLVKMLQDNDFVRSLTIQTMTYTGQGGGSFEPRQHIPVDGVERLIAKATGDTIRQEDFLPLPTAHPLCYGVNYLICGPAGGLHSFSELLDKRTIAEHLAQGYLLHPTDELEEELRKGIDQLWAEGGHEDLLGSLKNMLKSIFPSDQVLDIHERQRRAEKFVKTIYVHAHMDEDTYEIGRAMRCPDQVPVDAKRLISACNYNLFERQKDERFWVEP
jgi:uncharacterized radical SAM superfamily Fe-S cluster-containing enzyme